jgi:hypothetical protein
MSKRITTAVADLPNILTPEQRKMIADRLRVSEAGTNAGIYAKHTDWLTGSCPLKTNFGCQIVAEGLLIRVAKSKTDQCGQGQEVGIPRRRDDLCPVQALQKSLTAAGAFRAVQHSGQSLRGSPIGSRLTPRSERLIVKKRLGSEEIAYGLRAGYGTAVAAKGATAQEIMHTIRHRNVAQVSECIRHANVFQGTAHHRLEALIPKCACRIDRLVTSILAGA